MRRNTMPDAGVNGARIWYQEIGFGTKKPVKAILWYRSTVPGLVTSIFPPRLLFSRRHDPSGPAPGYWTATRPEWTIRSNLQKNLCAFGARTHGFASYTSRRRRPVKTVYEITFRKSARKAMLSCVSWIAVKRWTLTFGP